MRTHWHFNRIGKPYQIVSLEQTLSKAPAATSATAYLGQWMERTKKMGRCLSKHRDRFFGSPINQVEWLTMPIMAMRVFVGPWLELMIWTALPLGAIYGFISWQPFLLLALIMVGSSFFITLLALILAERQQSSPSGGALFQLIALGLFEYLGIKQLVLLVQTKLLRA
jgi:hypothetical protein